MIPERLHPDRMKPADEQFVNRPEALCPELQTFNSSRKTLLLKMLSIVAGSADAGSLPGPGLFKARALVKSKN